MEEKTEAQKIAEERQELEKFRDDLLTVHKQLEPKAMLFQELEKRGITSVENLNMLNSAREPKKEETVVEQTNKEMQSDLGSQDAKDKRIEQLEGDVEQMRDIIVQQDTRYQTDKMLTQIKNETKDKPDYALTSKAVDENIAHNILHRMQADKKEGKELPLKHYLDDTEKNLRGFYTKLGGTLEESKAIPQSAEKKSEQSGSINFPSLPASSDQSSKPEKGSYQKFLEKGRDPVTGIVDQNKAFESDLQDFLQGN